MSRTAEFALEQMCRTMGRSEQAEQQRLMRQACDDKTMADIVADFRSYSVTLPVPKDNTALATPAGAGRVQTWGWCDPVPLQRRDWASMTKEEIAQRDLEWKRDYEARKAAEKQVKDDQSKD
jgi:hypothetical protein